MSRVTRLRTIAVAPHSVLLLALLTTAFSSGAGVRRAHAQSCPPGFFVENAFPAATFSLPSLIVFAPDGRKLVVEKEGKVWVITSGGTQLPTPFIDLSVKVLSNDDRGLHGVVFDPDYATNRWVYFLYTADPDSNGSDVDIGAFARLERYKTSIANPNVIDLATRHILIGGTWATGIPEPCSNRHHPVGTLRFAPDKTLLVGSGDAANADVADAGGLDPLTSYGAGRTDPAEDIGSFRARTLNSMDGKILRVNKETGGGLSSNPYWDGNAASDRSRVWLYGLRNPFRFSIRPGTGSTNPALGQPGVLYIGDVGWNKTEELSIARQGGLNLGWPCVEGSLAQPGYQAVDETYFPNANVLCGAAPSAENPAPNTAPALWWDHSDSTSSNPFGWMGNCAIGGDFYTGSTYPPAYQGAYFIADYGMGWIRRVQVDGSDNVTGTAHFIDGAGGVVDIETDPATGDLYYVDINTSTIMRIRYSPSNLPPVVNASVIPASGYTPLTVTATASGSTDPDGDPLTFHWDFGDGGTSESADTMYTYESAGSFQASVTVSDNHGGISQEFFPVVAGQAAPPGTIVAPADSAFFHQGQPMALEAAPADTQLGPATYRWDVDLHHNNHTHPAVETYFGLTTSFNPSTPNDGERYNLRLRLSVTQGAVTSADTVTVWPRLNVFPASISFAPAAVPAGGTVQVTVRVKSIGEVGSSSSAFELREGAVLLASGVLSPIPNGDSLDVAVAVGPLTLGSHTFQFIADSVGALVETDEVDNSISGTVAAGGLVAAYGFDEGSGPTAGDATTNNLDGVIHGAAWTPSGKYGSALSFNGSSAYVDLGNPALLQLTGSMTLSAWVKAVAETPDDGQIIAKSDDSGGWQLKTSPDTGVRTFGVRVSGAPGSNTARYTTTVRTLGTWYHVAGVYDASTHTLQTYVNGALDSGTLIGTVPAGQFDPPVAACIGRRLGGYYFNGIIDEVRVYNRVLTQAEIQADMNTPVASVVGVDGPVAGTPPPPGYELSPASPNPFNPRTTLRFAIPRQAHVKLQVFKVGGELVATLVDRELSPGHHEASFDARGVASGLYLCRMQSGGFTATRKLFLLR